MAAPDYADEIAKLEAAASTGELTIETAEGDRLTYRSTADLMIALSYFRAQARAAGTASRRSGTTLAAYEAD